MRLEQMREHADRLGFLPRESVRWLAPAQLLRTGMQVAMSATFAGYLDKRELQDNLGVRPLSITATADGGAWLDFVADLGDGFDSTYTVASLLAEPELSVTDSAGQVHVLPRGQALVLGGDEVYPTASATEYDDRMRGPYRAALPEADPKPLMLALPGNHDWYDGLTAFLRGFTQEREIGGWQTQQSRSYFVVNLPGRWWLVGLDTQLGTEIDEPQRNYFRQQLSARLQPGDGVIVCVPTPTWVQTKTRDVDAFNTLNWFDRTIVRQRLIRPGVYEPTGAQVRLWLSGDHHHYVRYTPELAGPTVQEEPATHAQPGGPSAHHSGEFIVCGLGGAYLAATHNQPETLVLPPPESRFVHRDVPVTVKLAHRYPSAKTSRSLRWGLLKVDGDGITGRNPGFWRVTGMVQGALFLGLAALLGLTLGTSPAMALRTATLREVAHLGVQGAVWLGVVLTLWAIRPTLSDARKAAHWGWVAFVIGASQGLLAFGGLATATLVPWPEWFPDAGLLLVGLVGAGVILGLLSAYLVAVQIVLAPSPGPLDEVRMSAQAIEDYKGFLRLHIDGSGDLTVYPLAVDKVCRDWDLEPVPGDSMGRLRPVAWPHLPAPHLIEDPIRISREP